MKRTATALTTLLLLAIAPGVRAAGVDQTLQGKWLVAQTVYTPNDNTKPVAAQLHKLGKNVEFAGNRFQSTDPKKKFYFTVTTTGSNMDLKPSTKGGDTLHAVYSVSDKTLTIRVGTQGNRPTDSDTNATQVRMVLVRVQQ